ncbi:hypothetical protein TBLA_0J00230 [Henningerozyma blattae CBS 6284]|uniref:RRM domain-containing protein n=1 Tax=Henningerozyma blattae (strain ATCC 34711 / CBS 6284 / DSM 70876 / NBRC 10599 / NRRL Y-10934 / UCD 77-7) TaxID=1071380 RepID=I2H9H1_HENB6|nr:hypothetical protein TBLA_0J00230 [Tetrapisispora blattae CBS 6284]CCH63023.1 hypothetical protein TBLA_0J00230 [Tetrapisispora blattae CBS 6284]
MVPPKKKTTTKMDLNSFLNDDTFGSSWAEEDVDLDKINIPIENVQANTIPLDQLASNRRPGYSGNTGGFGSSSKMSRLDPALNGAPNMGGGSRRDRTEYPIPEYPPFRAIVNNIPWDISEEGMTAWIEDGLQKQGAVVELELPKTFTEPIRLKGMAFVTLKTREDLVKVLSFNASSLNERTVYVSVAAPRKDFGSSRSDLDWGAARGSNFATGQTSIRSDLDWGAARGSNFNDSGPRRERREEANLDWSAARGSHFNESSAPRRERREEPNLDWSAARGSNFNDSAPRRERREEPNLDWSAARGSNFSDSTPRRERREEANLDWSAARGSHFNESSAPRERREKKEEPNLDWGAARGSNFTESSRERRDFKPKKQEPELDWAAARNSTVKSTDRKSSYSRKSTSEEKTTTDQPKIQSSSFAALSIEDDDDDEEEENANTSNKNTDETTKLERKAAKLTASDDSAEGWEVAGKK